jgi:replicative DNA helicase
MATTAEQLISAVCEQKSVQVLLAPHVDELLGKAYGDVWASAKSYYSHYRTVPDIKVLTEEFPDFEGVEVSGDAGYYLEKLRSEHVDRRTDEIMVRAAEAKNKGMDPKQALEVMQRALAKLNKFTHNVSDMNLTDYEAAEAYYEDVRIRSEALGGAPGISTGVEFIDASYMTGMAPGHLIVAIGWPGKAKTWVTAWLACNAFLNGFNPMIFSLEMSGHDMQNRIYTMLGQGMFSASGFARGDVNLDDFRTFAQSALMKGNNFHVVSRDTNQDVTPNVIQAKIEQHHPDMLVLDYAQLLSDNRRSEGMTSRMMNLSQEVKALAVLNNIPIILITAATAEDSSDRNQPPTLDKVAWSKAIEYDADMAFAVQRNDETGDIEIVGRKNRHGELFSGFLQADLDRGVWKEVF